MAKKQLQTEKQALKEKNDEFEKLRHIKAESDNDYKKELSNLKRALDGKTALLADKEVQITAYQTMERNFNREFYRAESQLQLLKELVSNDN